MEGNVTNRSFIQHHLKAQKRGGRTLYERENQLFL